MMEFIYEHMVTLAGLAFAIATICAAAWSRTLPASCRQYGHAATLAVGAMAVAYLLTTPAENALGIGATPIRFVGYTVMWVPIILVMAAVAGVGQRLTALLLAIVLGRVWITFVSWFLDGVLSLLATLAPFALLVAGLYVLFGPMTHVAETRSPARSLLFNKLKYLVALAWIGLVANGLISGDALGLVDEFVGLVAIAYTEAILIIGFAGIVHRSVDALEETAASTGLLSFEPDDALERVDRTEPEAAD